MPPPAERSRGQHHRGLALAVTAGLAVAAFLGFGGLDPNRLDLWHRLTGPEVDGSWRFVSIDGEPVRRHRLTLDIRWGTVRGGHDGCNWWGFGPVSPDGRRSITTSLVACDPQPFDAAYHALARGQAHHALTPDGRLTLAAPGHRAVLERLPAT